MAIKIVTNYNKGIYSIKPPSRLFLIGFASKAFKKRITRFTLLRCWDYSMASRNVLSLTKSRNSHTIKPPPSPTPTPSRTCLCSPTTHPGSFRCSMHKKPPRAVARPSPQGPSESSSVHVKANSLKAILLQMIKPSSHDLHKRRTYHPKPTRFCLMNGNRDSVAVS